MFSALRVQIKSGHSDVFKNNPHSWEKMKLKKNLFRKTISGKKPKPLYFYRVNVLLASVLCFFKTQVGHSQKVNQ